MKNTRLRMERQHLLAPANETEYDMLYRDLQPGQNVYWNGFGQPPTLSFRADFDDLAYNKSRQLRRELIKGRFAGGNLGWILPEDLELFAALYRKPLKNATMTQQMLLERIEMSGPYTIGQLKEESGLLVKEITPALHRLQEAFLIYEDQYDGEWDRGWYRFGEFFPDFSLDRYTKTEALKIVLRRLRTALCGSRPPCEIVLQIARKRDQARDSRARVRRRFGRVRRRLSPKRRRRNAQNLHCARISQCLCAPPQ